MPLCGTAIAAFSVFTILWAWNDLMWPLIMTSRDSVRVLSVGIASLTGQYSTRYNLIMAASMLAITPMIGVFILLQKQFISGIAVTGLKA
jgi:multiple sugar transport system permease protein